MTFLIFCLTKSYYCTYFIEEGEDDMEEDTKEEEEESADTKKDELWSMVVALDQIISLQVIILLSGIIICH